jgi:hypothetical protein
VDAAVQARHRGVARALHEVVARSVSGDGLGVRAVAIIGG